MRSTLLAAILAIGFTAVLDVPVAFAASPQAEENAEVPAAVRPAPRRRALLIGVENYRPADYQTGSAPYSMLRNLDTTCRGAEAISARLQTLGWSYDPEDANSEVQIFCNVEVGQISNLLRSTVADFDRENDFLIIYLAGHGAEIEGRNYFFGPMARIDLADAAERLSRYQRSLLFIGHAIELGSAIFEPATPVFRGNILLILDTCSNDIVYDSLGERLRRPVGAPQTDVPPLGVSVFYANTPGRRVRDGVGLSQLARAIDQLAVAGLRIDTITSNIARHVTQQTRSLPPDQFQQPIRIRDLNNTDLCLAGCAIFAGKANVREAAGGGGSKRASAGARGSGAGGARPVAQAAPSPPAPQPPAAVSRRFTIYQGFPGDSTSPVVNADIYWCEGMEQERRAAEASQLAALLTRSSFTAALPESPGGLVRLGTVRARALSREENARADLRISGNVARIGEGSPHAVAMANRIRSAAMDNLRIEPVRGSGDTMSLFVCSGVATAPQAPRLRVQVAREDQRSLGTLVSAVLDDRLENLWVTSSVDVDEQRSPATTQVRFFYESDRVLADRIADEIGRTLDARPRIAYLPYYSGPRVRPGSTELWIGSDVRPLALFGEAQ